MYTCLLIYSLISNLFIHIRIPQPASFSETVLTLAYVLYKSRLFSYHQPELTRSQYQLSDFPSHSELPIGSVLMISGSLA